MKKTLSIIAVLLCILQIASAEAPELRNMMPNSWRKLARLSGEEEKEFFTQKNVKEDLDCRQKYYNEKTNKKIDVRVYSENCSGIKFYRVLYCNENIDDFYSIVYKNCTITQEEYEYWQDIEMLQSLFIKKKNNDLRFIGGTSYHDYWVSQGKWEGYNFSDIMIKSLNKEEIGFFVTGAIVSFYIERLNDDKKNVIYRTVKNQQAGFSRTCFSKYKLTDDIRAISKNDSITIDSSNYLFDPKCPLKYSIQNAFDGNPATSYVENTEDDLMKIEFSGFKSMFSKNVDLAIINGYALNEKYYYANNRIIGLNANSYKINDEKTELIPREPIKLELKDGILEYQILTFDYKDRIGSFSFSTTKVVNGNSFNDTCIAELNLRESKNFVFGDIDE